MEQFCTWAKVDGCDRTGDPISREEHCAYFEKELCFYFGKIMTSKHSEIFNNNVKYINNDNVNDMHDLAGCLTPPLIKGDE